MDHGEEVFPEPESTPASASSRASSPESATTAESQEHPANEPKEAAAALSSGKESADTKIVTTQEPKPLRVPEHINVRITPENLKDYVGPPLYHKDRMYIVPPPPGVSTGLGYLGNGSGAVMPVEATVTLLVDIMHK